MSEKYAGLTLGVDVSQVNNAVKSLKDMKRANEEAAKSTNEFADSQSRVGKTSREMAREAAKQRKEFADIEKIIDPTADKMRKLAQASRDLDRLWAAGALPDKRFYQLGEILEAQNNKLIASRLALTEEGRAAAENAAQKQKAANAAKTFLQGLEAEVSTIGKTRTELLEIQAAQLGVSKQAAPLIAQLKGQTKQMQLAGLSARQYAQAMRMLPAQITDVATSLAGGMPIWLVAIQQGGQIKDSFGGIGNTFKVLLSYLTPMRIALGATVGILGGMAKAAWDAHSAQRELANALILTGGYAGKTTGEFTKMAEEISSGTNATIGAVSAIVTELAKTGRYTKTQIQDITRTTAQWAAVTGESSSKITSYFEAIADDPVKGLAKLNEQFNFLEKGQLTHIAALEETKGKTEAVTEATRIFADTMESRLKDVADSAMPLEKMWDDIAKWSSKAWQDVKEGMYGGLNLLIDVVAATVEQVKYLINQGDIALGEFVISAIQAVQKLPKMGDFGKGIVAAQAEIVQKSKQQNEELIKSIEERNRRVAAGERHYIEIMRQQEQAAGYDASRKDQVRKEAEEIAKRNKAQSKSLEQGVKLTNQYEADILALRAQLEVLREHKTINDRISQQRKDLWTQQAKIKILEQEALKRSLTDEEKSVLANKNKILALAEQKAILGDQIVEQQRLNKLQDDSFKFITKMKAAIAAEEKTSGIGKIAAQRMKELEALKASYISKGGAETDPQLQEMMDKQMEFYKAEDRRRADWLAGGKAAISDMVDSFGDMYGNMYDVAGNALSGMTDMMAQFLATGEANFKDFAKSIISMIIKMIVQMSIFNALSGLGFGSSGGSAGASAGARSAGVSTAGVARSFVADGGEVATAAIEPMARARGGSLPEVMRGFANGSNARGEYNKGSGGGAGLVFTFGDINVDIDNGSDPKGIETGVRMIFNDMIQRACSQGGEVYNFVKGQS